MKKTLVTFVVAAFTLSAVAFAADETNTNEAAAAAALSKRRRSSKRARRRIVRKIVRKRLLLRPLLLKPLPPLQLINLQPGWDASLLSPESGLDAKKVENSLGFSAF